MIPEEILSMLKSNDPSTFKLGFVMCKDYIVVLKERVIAEEGITYYNRFLLQDQYWSLYHFFHPQYPISYDLQYSLNEYL